MKQKVRLNTQKQQRQSAELELIIEEFSRYMRSASKEYIARARFFTPNMADGWAKYVEFCKRYSNG